MEEIESKKTGRILIEAAIVLGILILSILAINFIYEKTILEKKQIYIIEEEYLKYAQENNRTIKYAFFGDSHTNNDANPRYIPGAYNFAVGGQNYIKIYHRLNKILHKDKVKIDTIIFGVDPHTFSSKFYDDAFMLDNLWFWINYYKFYSYEELHKLTGKSKTQLFIDSRLPFLGQGRDFEILFKNDRSMIYRGWIADNRNFSKENKTAVAKADYNANFRGQTTQLMEVGLLHFNKSINLARENNMTIIFIRYPLSREYLDNLKYNNITQEEYYDIIFKIIKDRLGSNYHFLDYQAIFMDNSEHYADSAHLNPGGSEEFSKRLYKDLVNLKNETIS